LRSVGTGLGGWIGPAGAGQRSIIGDARSPNMQSIIEFADQIP